MDMSERRRHRVVTWMGEILWGQRGASLGQGSGALLGRAGEGVTAMSGTITKELAERARVLSPPAAPSRAAPFVPLALADSKQRKMMPVISGCLDYFPDAIAAVSYVSYLGNQKHNPGQDLHWARGKSDDHIDCLGRHLLSRDGVDQDGIMEF